MSGFVGVFLVSFGGRSLDDMPTDAVTRPTWLLVFPIIVLSWLINGARERFSIRRKPSLVFWVAFVLIFIVVSYLIAKSGDYPWWLNLLVPAVLFVTMAATPVRQLLSSPISHSRPWANEPLSRSARWTTVLIGAAMGFLSMTGNETWLSIASAVVMMLLLVVTLFDRRLPRAGYEWGSIHWTAFGIVIVLLFALTVLLSLTGWITAPINIAAGASIFLVMLTAAFLPSTPSAG